MTWTKLDDGIFDHPKMVRAGEDAANLYVRGIVYCNRYLTDGRLDPEVLPVLTRKREAAKLAEALVRVGAWESHPDGGWLVHNFHEHNPTAEEVEARRAEISRKRSEAGKRGGLRSGEARSNEAKPKQLASEATKQNGSPVPSRPGLGSDDDDDKAAGAAVAFHATDRAPHPRRERNALEVLSQASGGVVSALASAPDMVAFNDLVASSALHIEELVAFGEALALRDGAKRIWPSSKARASGQTIPAGWLLGRGGRGRTLLEGIQRWRELEAAARAQPSTPDTRPRANTQPVAAFPAAPAVARPVASNIDEIKHLFPRKGVPA